MVTETKEPGGDAGEKKGPETDPVIEELQAQIAEMKKKQLALEDENKKLDKIVKAAPVEPPVPPAAPNPPKEKAQTFSEIWRKGMR